MVDFCTAVAYPGTLVICILYYLLRDIVSWVLGAGCWVSSFSYFGILVQL